MIPIAEILCVVSGIGGLVFANAQQTPKAIACFFVALLCAGALLAL